MFLNLFISGAGHHASAWRLPDIPCDADTNIEHLTSLCVEAERSGFDSIFLADQPGLWTSIDQRPSCALEPSVALAVMAERTSRIGLIGTFSTTFNEPYNLARRLASLDISSGGRIGWNIVTSGTTTAANNFGFPSMPSHAERYARAVEFTEACISLWTGWESGAVVGDKQSGIWGDPTLVTETKYVGNHVTLNGVLNVPRSPQVVPLLVQAGSSGEGIDFASRFADAVFTVQGDLREATTFAQSIRERTGLRDKNRCDVRVFPGIVPVVAATSSEAHDKIRLLSEMVDMKSGLAQLSRMFGTDMGCLSLDDQMPPDFSLPDSIEGSQGRAQTILSEAKAAGRTLREMIVHFALGRGHLAVVGSGDEVADIMESWHSAGAADGFNVMPAVLPDGLDDFIRFVIPVLKGRGLMGSSMNEGSLRMRYCKSPWS